MLVRESDLKRTFLKKKKKENPKENPVRPPLQLDEWQKEVLAHKGNKVICSGRQTGKSTVVSILASEKAVNEENQEILIVSVTEDQAKELLMKCLFYLEDFHPHLLKGGLERPTKDTIKLKNGSRIRTKACGISGSSLRGPTTNLIIVDESAFMPEIWSALTPQLLTTGGDLVLLSTPFGRNNYFYKCYNDPQFRVWHVNTINIMENRPISETWSQFQRDKALEYLKSEKYRLSDKEFQQEYEGKFVEDLNDFFADDYIKKTLIQQAVAYTKEDKQFYIGVDIGRMGGDKTVFVIGERRGELMIQRELVIWDEAYLDRIALQIIEWDKVFHFKKIYLDNGGIGIGVFDMLYNTPGFKARVKGINNAEKIVEFNPDGSEKRARWMKEEIYTNLLFLMMKGKILLFDDGRVYLSLKAIQYEYINQRGGAMMKIDSPDHRLTHIAEATVRLAMAMKDKLLYNSISYL